MKALFLFSLVCLVNSALGCSPPTIAFSRIVHGWTNYSTAFNVTHDTAENGGHASVGAFYTPQVDVSPFDYSAILIWSGTQPPDFSHFQFRVMVWSSLDAFIQEPREGDVATWNFSSPTGGSSSIPDATTRGGRPVYELRFQLPEPSVVLSNGQTYVVGFAARTDTQSYGEIFIPTSSHDGQSDVHAGDLVPGGWRYLRNAGGSTIYSGQLAMELVVTPRVARPRLGVSASQDALHLSWSVLATNFTPEFSFGLGASEAWQPVEGEIFEENGERHVILPTASTQQWFRLRR